MTRLARNLGRLSAQPIPCAAHGFDEVGAADGGEGFAQAFDVDVDRAFLDEDVVAPDPVEQLGAAVHAFGVASRKCSSLNSVAPSFTSPLPVTRCVAGSSRSGPTSTGLSSASSELHRGETHAQIAISSSVENGLVR